MFFMKSFRFLERSEQSFLQTSQIIAETLLEVKPSAFDWLKTFDRKISGIEGFNPQNYLIATNWFNFETNFWENISDPSEEFFDKKVRNLELSGVESSSINLWTGRVPMFRIVYYRPNFSNGSRIDLTVKKGFTLIFKFYLICCRLKWS